MSSSLPTVFLACEVFKYFFGETHGGAQCRYIDHSLHLIPKKLSTVLQEELNKIEAASFIVIGFGLCGNGLNGIKSGKHTLVIPKADDCIAIFMGSRARYTEQFNKNPGTYYLTCGWFEAGSDPLSEYGRVAYKYGRETADSLMAEMYGRYTRLVFTAVCDEDFEAWRPRALETAALFKRFGMVYEEYRGTDEFLLRIGNILKSQSAVSSDFIIVPPGKTVRQEMFT